MQHRLNASLFLLCLSLAVPATVLSVTSGDVLVGNRGTNLLTNGSFEADAGFAANGSYWATGTTLTPAMSLAGWSASGQSQSYAIWGNDGSGSIVGSEFLPDGANGLYFGAGVQGAPSVLPTFHADGTVTFASTPTFSPKPTTGPVTLSQTVTGLNTSQSYTLDFWVSAEDSRIGGQFGGDGFFGLDLTGESTLYFDAPMNVNALGTSQRYYVQFQPNSSTMTLTWTNWGHYVDPVTGLSTEIVLDDVILNHDVVPEPCSLVVLGSIAVAVVRRKRR